MAQTLKLFYLLGVSYLCRPVNQAGLFTTADPLYVYGTY